MIRIQELTSRQLQDWMLPSDEARIVEFYASWCIYHLLTFRKLQQLSNALSDVQSIGRIDCLGNESLFETFEIDQIPTIGYFCGETRLVWVGDTDLDLILSEIARVSKNEHVR